MGPPLFSISPLEQFLTTETVDESSNISDVSTIDLKDICALRERSIRKFVGALDDIAVRYEGDGDEEADDVIDLEHLVVIEERGYILNRFSNQSGPSKSSLSSPKGKCRADEKLGMFDILDPNPLDDDEEWLEDEDAEDGEEEWLEEEDAAEDGDDDQSGIHSAADEDHNGDDDDDGGTNEDYSSHHSDPPSISSSSSSCKIPFEAKAITRKKLVYPNSTCSSSVFSDPSPIRSIPQRPATSVSCFDNHTITNELFERLKRRIQERSSDINKHRLFKQSTYPLQEGQNDLPSFSSPTSSLVASSSLSSALTPTEYMISPYLQRLLHPDYSTDHSLRGTSRVKSPTVPVNIIPRTPATVRKRRIEDISSGCISLHEKDTTIGKSRRRGKRGSETPSLLGTPTNQTHSSRKISSSTSRRTERQLKHQDFVDDQSSITTSDQFKPALLFKQSLPQRIASSDDESNHNSPPVFRQYRKFQSPYLNNVQPPRKPPLNNTLEKSEQDQFSRESSEDPLYLPPSRSKKSRLF